MVKLVGKLEALDQAITELIIRRFSSMALEPFAQALYGVRERVV